MVLGPFGNQRELLVICPVSSKNIDIFICFQRGLTSADKMRFEKCQMDAKDPPNAKEHVLGPSDFTKHWKLENRPPNFNSEYAISSSKPRFSSRSPSGDLWILDSCFRILGSCFWILDLGFWILDYGLCILNYEL